MTGKQLKNSILQWAIQGKLVPQDPNDEPASVLLDRIRKEKAQPVKAGKLKKKDLEETPIAEDEKPFEIPESWEWVKIGDVFIHSSGKQLKGGDTDGELHEYITTSNLYWDRFELDNLKSMYYKDSELQRCSAQKGDLLVCEGGDIGRSAIWPYDYTIFLQNHVHRLRPYFQEYTRYVYYVMWSFKHTGLVGGKGIGIQGLSASALKKIAIPLPPLAEQHRIVAKIEELLPKVEKYGETQEALDKLNTELPERLKKSILQEAIEGRLVPQDPNDEPASVLLNRIREEKKRLVKAGKLKKKDLEETPITEDEKPFEIPESWEWVKLQEVISLLSGQDLVPQRYSSEKRGIPYITGASCFNNGKLVLNRWTTSPTSVSHKGDLLVTCKGTVGTMAFNTIGDIHIARQIMAISSFGVCMPYLKCFIEYIVPDLEKKAHSIIPGISREDLLNCSFPLPPLFEQHRIVSKIEELFGNVDKLKA